MTLTDEQEDRIADKLADRLMSAKRAQWIDPETHSEHHEWVRGRINNEAELRELKKRIVLSACIWAVPLILAFIASALWREIAASITGTH